MRQRSTGVPNLPLYIHDGFNLQKYSTYLSERSDFVIEDHHSYFVFTPADESEPAFQHTSDVRGSISGDLGAADSKDRENLVINEWSCALTAQSLSTQRDPDEARKQFCTTQMGVYANTSGGWSFWCASYRPSRTNPGPWPTNQFDQLITRRDVIQIKVGASKPQSGKASPGPFSRMVNRLLRILPSFSVSTLQWPACPSPHSPIFSKGSRAPRRRLKEVMVPSHGT